MQNSYGGKVFWPGPPLQAASAAQNFTFTGFPAPRPGSCGGLFGIELHPKPCHGRITL